MQLRLRTKLTLVMTGLVLLVVTAVSGVYFAQLIQQALDECEKRTTAIAGSTLAQINGALKDTAAQGWRPESNSIEDVRDYIAYALGSSQSFQAQLVAAKRQSGIYEVSVTDRDGKVLASTDQGSVGKAALKWTPLAQLTQRGFLHQVKVLAGPNSSYVLDYDFDYGDDPFGEIRVVVSTGLLLNAEILPIAKRLGTIVLLAMILSTVLAAVVSGATLAPLARISAQLDRISAGQYDAPVPEVRGFAGGSDELGLVSKKISQVGQQLRGVHEIFSSMRENMNSVMAGLEDGLVLFTRDARAVMVSPAAEKFLGTSAGNILGRRITDIFPAAHPLRSVLEIEGDELREVAAETELKTADGDKRVGVSVQAIQEDGERMGALLTLRDLDSLDNINTQLQVSERLSALGRVTAGVAHEVKNPLNSMRLWLENLKESLPAEQDGNARQAVQVLDKEIDRLDAVVKRFLDFTRPMEVRLEATQLAELLKEVLDVARPQLQKANVQVAQLLPIDVPEVYVDRDLLKQAVLNLLLNAGEAMPNGGQLRLVLSRRGEVAEISVGDTGKGIPPENRQKVFQLFFTTRPDGNGIGLASTFRIVQLMNGSIDFTTEVGKGTTFRIELPLAA